MFVFLSKLLPLLVYPLGLACALLILALIVRRARRAGIWLMSLALLLLWVGGNRWVAYSLARSLEWRYPAQADLAKADVILVLGGGTEPALAPRQFVEVNGAGDRVLYAARLYRQGVAPRILLSGGNLTFAGEFATTPASDMLDLLQLLDVPPQAVLLQAESENTRDDAVFSTRMIRERGYTRVILITSARHMPRSVALFQRLGLEVIPAPVDYAVTRDGWDRLLHANFATQIINLLPSANNLDITTDSLKEYLGMLAYKLQGWI